MSETSTDPQVAALLDKFRLEYDELTELRRRVDGRLAQLHTAMTALVAAETREPLKFDGSLSDACRAVLKSAKQPMTPLEVRDGVVSIGFQLSSLAHDNPMASIHAVLKRLADSRDVEKVEQKGATILGGSTRYRWTGRAQAERAAEGWTGLTGLLSPETFKSLSELMMRADSSVNLDALVHGRLRNLSTLVEASNKAVSLGELMKNANASAGATMSKLIGKSMQNRAEKTNSIAPGEATRKLIIEKEKK